MILDKETLKALRNATAIIFRHDQDKENANKGNIVVIKEIKEEGYNNGQLRKELEIFSEIYNHTERKYKYAHSHQSVSPKTENEKWQQRYNQFETILCMLKENDDISLYWYPDNNNDNMTELGWHNDMLILKVTRKEKYYSFKIEEHPYLDNTARMITDRKYY